MLTVTNLSLQGWFQSCIQNPDLYHNEDDEKCVCTYKNNVRKTYGIVLNDVLDDRFLSTSLETPASYFTKVIENMAFSLLQSFKVFANLMNLLTAQFHNVGEPLTIINLHFSSEKALQQLLPSQSDSSVSSSDKFSWGIIRSRAGYVNDLCSQFYETVLASDEFVQWSLGCLRQRIMRAVNNLVSCINSVSANPLKPMMWQEKSVYFDTSCICLLSNRPDCRTDMSGGVSPYQYCRRLLLKDLQKHITYRPAITYLDYTLKKRLSICAFSTIFLSEYDKECGNQTKSINYITEVLCFLNGLFNRPLNCSHKVELENFDSQTLCIFNYILKFTICHPIKDDRNFIFYEYGQSPLTLVFTSFDIVLRIITLVICLSFYELRNLPGKLFISYQITAIINIIFVKYIVAYCYIVDKSIAVYIDIYLDFACTCCLSAMSHFFYTSVKYLILPNDLSKDKQRKILCKYLLYSLAFPAIILGTCFYIDTNINSRIQYGQLVIMLICFFILLLNIVMFIINFHSYYDIKKSVRYSRKGTTSISYYTDLLNFSIKTLVLSGAGIIIRITLAQIENFESILNYFYILSSTQGIVIFCMFSCSFRVRMWIKESINYALFGQRQNSAI